jgi:hypothetical protein
VYAGFVRLESVIREFRKKMEPDTLIAAVVPVAASISKLYADADASFAGVHVTRKTPPVALNTLPVAV